MPRGNDNFTKVYYKGKFDDFVIFVDDVPAVHRWRKDRSVPLQQILNGWKIFVTHRHGAQGVLDNASKAMLDNEFGTHREEDCIQQILERGEVQETTNWERQADKNPLNGPVSSGKG
ncbi:hypothetical protein VTN96DRAFT_10005 [Rasamsonia emersonii]|uniref:RNA binding protein n=1 Tax=Rasamsonia emersonii (strain ATCC 16479 / CBS 393.64 / IMI 116815) TaxID=1408163 RepID=A0A0F4YQT6_RASE3|nr:RNA binding protein [Rasamsonia emersonii CBS 393.64]KKA19998.1 RNA binding protein [Rasamsonia emersonii CBS 393.64]